jgi:D-alanyl-lipoteichoic acid acyltransferase DltB (MBOAT superfamily)
MGGTRAPRLALCALGLIGLAVCGEIVARIQGDRLCIETPGAVLQADPRFGWSYVPGASGWVRPCAQPGVPPVDIDVTSSGRLDLERPTEKASGTVRLLLLGGEASSVLGVRHPLGLQPTTLARWLEARADRRRGAPLEVIDATTDGFSLDNELLYLRAEGLRYAPDVVVAVVDPDVDVRSLSPALIRAAGERVPVKPYFRIDDGHAVVVSPSATSAPSGAAASDGAFGLQLLRAARGLPRHSGPPVGSVPPPAQRDPTDLEADRRAARALAGTLLAALRDDAARAGARFSIALGPASARAAADAEALRDAARELGIPLLDLSDAFARAALVEPGAGRFPGTRRWDATGHFLAGEELWGFLVRSKLLPSEVVAAAVPGGGEVRDPATLPTAIVDAFHRDRHTLFPRFLQLGALAVCAAWVASPLPARARDWLLAAIGVAAAVVLGTPGFAGLLLAYALALFAAVELLSGFARDAASAALLAWLVLAPAYWFPHLLAGYEGDAREYASFATNVAVLRFAAYALDRRRAIGRLEVSRYLASQLFFPTFVNGPIQSSAEFAAARPADALAPESFAALGAHLAASARALIRAAIAVVLAYAAFSLLNDKLRLAVFATGGAVLSHPRLWLWVGELYFLFYFSFAAWSTAAISLGRMCGVAVPENFDHPWLARDVADFWRRWHISFGAWLRSRIYLPLGGGRRHAEWNILAVFLVSALWHIWGAVKLIGPGAYPARAGSGFLLWGLMNALGVIVSRKLALSRRPDAAPARFERARHLLAQALTFVFVSLAWVPLFQPPTATLGDCLAVFARLFYLR